MTISLTILLIVLLIGYLVLIVITLQWILAIKRETSSALLWFILVIVLPVVGLLFFLWFGYDRVHRPLKKKKRHRIAFRDPDTRPLSSEAVSLATSPTSPLGMSLSTLAAHLDGYPAVAGNKVTLLHKTTDTYEEILNLIDGAEHHLHLEYYIFQPDEIGKEVIARLIKKARAGVEVRLLYDSFGSMNLRRGMLRQLTEAGGKCGVFLAINLWRRRFQLNLRNHRKLVIADGKRAILGGMNLGREYLGKDSSYGYWRDTNFLIEGPVVACLQEIFAEDWHFGTDENINSDRYFPDIPAVGQDIAQVITGGPDQECNTLRGTIFAAFAQARERIWITSPYFVPDSGLIDVLKLALRQHRDVRLLIANTADSWLTWYASRYFLRDLLSEGLKVYQYNRGYLHAKVILVDEWAFVGSANFDNRSMHLNFELGCAFFSPGLIEDLTATFETDCHDSAVLTLKELDELPFYKRALENFARLFAPIL